MIVVTAPTSQIGGRLLDLLGRDEEPVRVVVRDPARLPPAVRDRVEVVTGSHGEPEVVAEALTGADALFWLVPPDLRAESVDAAYVGFSTPAAAALPRTGVSHVVTVSALGRGTPVAAQAGNVTATLAVDDVLADALSTTGGALRALVCPSFMDNLLRLVPLIRQGLLPSPLSPDRRAPSCATRDIAATAARLLRDRSWSGRAEVPVLGPDDLSLAEMAATLTQVLGRPVRVLPVSGEDYRARFLDLGMSPAMAQAMLDMALAKDAGLDDGVRRTPETASPTSFRTWCEEVLAPAVRS